MKHECILCDFERESAERTLFLYAGTSILQQIVESVLNDLGAQFNFKEELFAISGDHGQIILGLRSRLSDAERADIRVSGQRGAALLAAPTLDSYGSKLDSNWFDEALVNDRFATFFSRLWTLAPPESLRMNA